MLDAAATLETQMQPLAAFGRLVDHPWRGVQNIEITELDESRLISLISDWNSAIRDVLDRSSSLAQLVRSPLPETPISLEELCRRLTDVKVPPASLIAETYTACLTESEPRLPPQRDSTRSGAGRF